MNVFCQFHEIWSQTLGDMRVKIFGALKCVDRCSATTLWGPISNFSTPFHHDVIKWKHFPRYWPFVRGIHRSPVNSPHKGQWRGGLIFSLIWARINGWVNSREAGDLKRHRTHYDVIVMYQHGLSEIMAWISDNNCCFLWVVITHPCPNFNGGLTTPPLMLWHGLVITSRVFTWF